MSGWLQRTLRGRSVRLRAHARRQFRTFGEEPTRLLHEYENDPARRAGRQDEHVLSSTKSGNDYLSRWTAQAVRRPGAVPEPDQELWLLSGVKEGPEFIAQRGYLDWLVQER